jgi:hypothetical protein
MKIRYQQKFLLLLVSSLLSLTVSIIIVIREFPQQA